MTDNNPTISLNNGAQMPALGLGVYRANPGDTTRAVSAALEQGYRLIDTAAAYGNEQQVGEGISASGVARSEVFVTTKLWISDYGYDQTLHAFDRSLRKLGSSYVDLYLLHQPMPSEFEATVGAYKAAEKLLQEGRARAIGVSNFSIQHLESLMAQTDVVPAVNQIEIHPFFVQPALRDFHAEYGIASQAWSPIGGVNRYFGDGKQTDDPLKHRTIIELAEKYRKTPAQVVLRWHLQQGVSVIPKSIKSERIAENFRVFDFNLEASELAAIDALDTGQRGGPDPETIDTKRFNKTIED